MLDAPSQDPNSQCGNPMPTDTTIPIKKVSSCNHLTPSDPLPFHSLYVSLSPPRDTSTHPPSWLSKLTMSSPSPKPTPLILSPSSIAALPPTHVADHRGLFSYISLFSSPETDTAHLTVGIASLSSGGKNGGTIEGSEGGGRLCTHSHPQTEVYYILEGNGVVRVEGVERGVEVCVCVFVCLFCVFLLDCDTLIQYSEFEDEVLISQCGNRRAARCLYLGDRRMGSGIGGRAS
jgi:hypothetical protein